MGFIDSIFSLFLHISEYFYDAYSEVKGWLWPFNYLQYPLYALYRAFWSLLSPIAQLGNWVRDVSTKVSNILSQVDILSLLRTWLTYAENAWSWVVNAWQNVTNIIGTWWSSTSQTVKGWIDIAKASVLSIVDNVKKSLASLQTTWDNFWTLTWAQWIAQFNGLATAWDNFWKSTLPGLITGKAAGDLIISTLKTWFPFYDDLVKLWGSIKLFFTDPEDWLYKAVDRIIERFW